MKLNIFVFALLSVVSLALCSPVKREAEPEADPEADPGYGHVGYASPAAVSAPVCSSVPVKECVPRQVENPRKECHTTYDTIIDTTVTEHCEEVVTTHCSQTSQTSRHHSAVVGHDSKVVAAGVVGHAAVAVGAVHPGAVAHGAVAVPAVAASHSYGKRDADAEPEADAEADPEADADAGIYGYGPQHTTAPVCTSTPVRKCNQVPVETPRKVAKLVCQQVVDITTIEDCAETITTTCQQTSKKVAHTSEVVGKTTNVVAGPAVVATAPAVVASAPAHGHVGYGAGYGNAYGYQG